METLDFIQINKIVKKRWQKKTSFLLLKENRRLVQAGTKDDYSASGVDSEELSGMRPLTRKHKRLF